MSAKGALKEIFEAAQRVSKHLCSGPAAKNFLGQGVHLTASSVIDLANASDGTAFWAKSYEHLIGLAASRHVPPLSLEADHL